MNKILLIVFFSLSVGCQNSPAKFTEHTDPPPMRHGWTIFTGPKPTVTRTLDLSSAKRGQRVYLNHCVGCHGPQGKGNGEIAGLFSIKPANLNQLSRANSNHYLVIQINNGKGNMPSWQDLLTPQETWDVTSYIQTLNDNHAKQGNKK